MNYRLYYDSDAYIKSEKDFKDSLINFFTDNIDHFNSELNVPLEKNPFYLFLKDFEVAKSVKEKYILCINYYDEVWDIYCSHDYYYDLFSAKDIIQIILDNPDIDFVSNPILKEGYIFLREPKCIISFQNLIDRDGYYYSLNSTISRIFQKIIAYIKKNNPIKYLPKDIKVNVDWKEVVHIYRQINKYKIYYNTNLKDLNNLLNFLDNNIIEDNEKFESILKIFYKNNISLKTAVNIYNKLPDKTRFFDIIDFIIDNKVKNSDALFSVIDSFSDEFANDFEKFLKIFLFIESMENKISIYDINFQSINSKKYVSVINANFTIIGVYTGTVNALLFCKLYKKYIIKFILFKIRSNYKYKNKLKASIVAPIQFYKISDLRVNAKTGDCQIKLDLKEI